MARTGRWTASTAYPRAASRCLRPDGSRQSQVGGSPVGIPAVGLILEAPVDPQILLRRLAHIVLDGGIDAGGIGQLVLAGKISQRCTELDPVAAAGQAI